MHFRTLGLGLICAAALLAGCASDKDGKDTDPAVGDTDYVSANPGGPTNGSGNKGPALDSGSGGSTSGAPSAGEDDGVADPSRAIEEADIIKVSDGTLYALSRYGGLSVIDVSVRDQLKLLGRFKTDAMPFEMYVRGGVVFALFNDYGGYEVDAAGNYTWAQSSRVVTLDVSDPDDIQELASFRVPGSISDSRIVGDVLYVVGYQDGYCWGCVQNSAGTAILSLDVSEPMDVTKVDELRYEDSNNEWGGWRRSVTVTEDRMYVAGVEYSSTGDLGSTINVIDISDPAGDLVAGTRVEAEGQISSRWQMDEYNGVLRVVSQPPDWNLSMPPVVQTWQVNSSKSLTKLGRTEMVLPRPEQLQSVRFDGPRGYAVTFERTDPLFTLDLTDPATPVQSGELEIPGWLYYMEPRGDRLLGLGYDQGNAEGSVTVSLFDVTDLSQPTMLDRVNFGGDWSSLPEDQDRIHKAFNVLDDAGMILVPFSGYSYTDVNAIEGGCGSYKSGVQLVDWAADNLTLRGVASSVGEARRGFLLEERLFTVSDERVQAFDIADRDEPSETADLRLLNNVNQTVVAGDYVVRMSSDWWSSEPRVEVTTIEGAEDPVPLGALDLAPVISTAKGSCQWGGWYPRKLLANGQYAYVIYDGYTNAGSTLHVAAVDISDPTNPTLVGSHTISQEDNAYYGYYGYNLAPSGSDIVQVGTTLGLLRSKYDYTENSELTTVTSFVDVIDMSDPQNPSSQTVQVPVGLGTTALLASGETIALSHYEKVDSRGANVRFYMDRIDVSNAKEPQLLPKVNIPGSLLAYDNAAHGVITVDYTATEQEVAGWNECTEALGNTASFEPYDNTRYDGPGTCRVIEQTLKLVRLASFFAAVEGTYELGKDQRVALSTTGSDRTFVTLSSGYGYAWADCYDCGYGYGGASSTALITLAGITSGDFAAGRLDIEGGDYWSASALVASGTRVLLSSGWRGKLSVIEAADAAQPVEVKSVPVYGYVQDLDVAGDVAIASLGYDGVQLISLAD